MRTVKVRTVKVREKDFEVNEYSLRVECPYCKNIFYFFVYEKWIDKVDCCPNCGKEIYVKSEAEKP